jgi:hypothetical protein
MWNKLVAPIAIGICAVTWFLFVDETSFNKINHLVSEVSEVGAPTPTWEELIVILEAEQETLLQKYGDYIQVSPDGRVLYKGNPVNENKFKNKVPENVQIHVYETPDGQIGFQIVQIENGVMKSYAIGPEAADRTYTIDPYPSI